jgi:hypothetical protein
MLLLTNSTHIDYSYTCKVEFLSYRMFIILDNRTQVFWKNNRRFLKTLLNHIKYRMRRICIRYNILTDV